MAAPETTMPFGDNGTLNATNLAMVFSQVLTTQAMAISRRKNGLLYFLLGKEEPGSESANGGPKFERLDDDVAGQFLEWTLQAQHGTYTAVADGSGEMAAISPTFDNNVFAGAKADITHFPVNENLTGSQLKKMSGPYLKVKSYVENMFNYWLLKFEKTLGVGINGMSTGSHVACDQSQTLIGSWTYAVSDSTDAAWVATNKTYGGIDRSIAANADFAGNSTAMLGANLSLKDLGHGKTQCMVNGATELITVAGQTVYDLICDLVEAAAGTFATTIRNNNIDYSGEYFTYRGMEFILDAYAPPQIVGQLSPQAWRFKLNKDSFDPNEASLKRNDGYKSMWSLFYDFYAGLICLNPGQNNKIIGVTG